MVLAIAGHTFLGGITKGTPQFVSQMRSVAKHHAHSTHVCDISSSIVCACIHDHRNTTKSIILLYILLHNLNPNYASCILVKENTNHSPRPLSTGSRSRA